MTTPQSQQRPQVIVVAGPAASGKTTLARAMSRRAGFAHVDLDDATGPLVGEILRSRGEPAHALDLETGRLLRPARYDTVVGLVRANLHLGVVLSAPCTKETSSLDNWGSWCTRLTPEGLDGVRLVVVSTSSDVITRRLRDRGEPRDALKISGDVEGPRPAPPVAHVVADGVGEVESEASRVLTELGVTVAGPERLTCSS